MKLRSISILSWYLVIPVYVGAVAIYNWRPTQIPTSIEALVNEYRSGHSLKPLIHSERLTGFAEQRCKELERRGAFNHDGWTGVFAGDSSFMYRRLGENLARNFTTDRALVDAWIASEGHRKNLEGKYTYVGTASCSRLVVELYGA